MKQEKAGDREFFFDTYALFAIALGQETYKKYTLKVKVHTTIKNLYEMYYVLIEKLCFAEAEKFFDKFLKNCIPIEPTMIKEAAKFRLQYKKLGISYIDALGYIISRELKIPFLTGDKQFETMENVEFVK